MRVFCALEGGSGGMAEVRKHCGESSGRYVVPDLRHAVSDSLFDDNPGSFIDSEKLDEDRKETVEAHSRVACGFQKAHHKEPLERVFRVEPGDRTDVSARWECG